MGVRDAQCLRALTILAERTREPEFDLQRPHGTAQPFMTSVPGDLVPSSSL